MKNIIVGLHQKKLEKVHFTLTFYRVFEFMNTVG